MPIYQYQCPKCDKIEDYLLARDASPNECADCGNKKGDFHRIYHGEAPNIGTPSSSERNSSAKSLLRIIFITPIYFDKLK